MEYGFITLLPTLLVLGLAIWSRRTLESVLAGALFAFFIMEGAGFLDAMAAATLNPEALFLMAPALYMDGYPGDPAGCPSDTEVVHGWDDDIVPLASSLAFAKRRRARLHLVPDDHRLAASLDFIDAIFRDQLTRVRAAHSSADSVSAR